MKIKYFNKFLVSFGSFLIIFIATHILNNYNDSSKSQLVVAAAASLEPVMEEIKQAYQQSFPHVILTYNFGASGLLQQQIERGAPVDIFMSASSEEIDKLAAKKLIKEETYHHFLRNHIALITNQNTPKNLTQISDLTHNQIAKITIGDPHIVPAGRYAQQILNYYQLTEKIKDKLVFAKDEQAILTYVELGYTDVGFVYHSSTFNHPQVKTITIVPDNSHQSINYSLAVMKSSSRTQLTEDFLHFLQSDLAQQIFTEYKFNYLLSPS